MVEVRPEIELGDIDGLVIRKRLAEVADKDVDQVLERLVDSRATYEKVERAAAIDDQILLDLFPAGDDGEFSEDGKIPDQKFVLGSPNNMPAFNEGLVGCSAGEDKTVTVEYPDVDFVHVEVYGEFNEPGFVPDADHLVPAVVAFGLPTEPWVFVVDEDGMVTGRFDGVLGVGELEGLLSQ